MLSGVGCSECAIEADGIACSAIYLENFCSLAVANNAKCVLAGNDRNARVVLDRQSELGELPVVRHTRKHFPGVPRALPIVRTSQN